MQNTLLSTAIFAGCVRNCERWLPKVLNNIEKYSSYFLKSHFIFIENDSTDNTKKILQKWYENKNYSSQSIDGLKKISKRGLRLETARNTYLKIIKNSNYLSKYDYLIVMDFDDASIFEIERKNLLKSIKFLNSDENIAGVFANQRGTYYDMWTLRHKTICPGDVWEEVLDYSIKNKVSDEIAYENTLKKRKFSLKENDLPLEVDSAFGGFGIYKINYILKNKKSYVGSKTKIINNNNQVIKLQVCEHVQFNFGIKDSGGKLYVLPYLINGENKGGDFPASTFRYFIF